VVWEGGNNGDGSKTAAFLHDMARVMPPMLQVMKDVGGVEVPDYLARIAGSPPASTSPSVAPQTDGRPTAAVSAAAPVPGDGPKDRAPEPPRAQPGKGRPA
jgi:flotillin